MFKNSTLYQNKMIKTQNLPFLNGPNKNDNYFCKNYLHTIRKILFRKFYEVIDLCSGECTLVLQYINLKRQGSICFYPIFSFFNSIKSKLSTEALNNAFLNNNQ